MYKIAVLPGDGIGREIVPEAVAVLEIIAEKFNTTFEFTHGLISEDAYQKYGHPLPQATLDLCKSSHAVLLGAVGSPAMDQLPPELRPERAALLPLRKELGLYANLRPITVYDSLIDSSTLKPEVVQGVNILTFRELTGGLYFGPKERRQLPDGGCEAIDTLVYTTREIERIARLAFEAAQKRSKRLTSVDKANVLESSRLWRETVTAVAADYPDVTLTHMYVDNCAMQLVRWPKQFDVIVTENMFGDILTDQASMLGGSLGMLASASLGGEVALYEPAHGSAPDIAGQNKANPLATILSAALMLRFSFNMNEAAEQIETAVRLVLEEGYRTPDIAFSGCHLVGTKEMGSRVREILKTL
ncbi:MAG TPA: 3-isopropylmalate dehydrogenase [Bacillota bacterium]|nr:3-isopropylmalate dehydrogenase [Bacillota bacterium]HPT86498.1 3-isopropylmalate dehydrogenase [Bacillota bacterium]